VERSRTTIPTFQSDVVALRGKARRRNDDRLKERLKVTNGGDRLDRVERILDRLARSQEQFDERQVRFDQRQVQFDERQAKLDERQVQFDEWQAKFAERQVQFDEWRVQWVKSFEKISKTLNDMAARQHYHDEAFERHDAEMKEIREETKALTQAISIDAENIRALVRIAELHHQRLEHLEGGQQG